MRVNPIVILTQEKDDNASLAKKLAVHNVHTLCYPCIATRFIKIDENVKIGEFNIADFQLYVFTSKRAVQAITHMRDLFRSVSADFACVGDTTERELEQLLGITCKIKPKYMYTALALSKVIIEKIPQPLTALHVRGDKSSGVLKRELEANGWHVFDLITYENYAPEIKPIGDETYNAAVFASPSAAQRFFSVNPNTKVGLKCVAIGTTTADYLVKTGVRHITICEQSDKDKLIETILNVLSLE